MRILSAKVENYMGVKLFDADFDKDKNVVEITGKNGQGKTGSLDGIWAAIAGKGAIADNPIREGEESATLQVNFGHLIATRKFKRKEEKEYTTNLTLTTPEGARFPKPQEMLNEFFNSIALDPIEFLRKESKQQTLIFRSLISDFDFDENDEQINTLAEKRQNTNRDVKSLQARVDAFQLPAKLPEDAIDEHELIKQLAGAQERNQERQNEISRRDTSEAEIKGLRDTANAQSVESASATSRAIEEGHRLIAEAKAQADKLRADAEIQAVELSKEAETKHQAANDIQAKLDELLPIPGPINPTEIQELIEEAKASNALYSKKQQYDALAEELRLKKLEARGFDGNINELRKKAEDAVKTADLPVPGIGFDENGLTFKGLPLSQASKAEQIRVCCAIVAALNPELRICRISDGSLLDQMSFDLLEGFAKKYDMQVFIETVESSRQGAIVIEAGEIVSKN
ncbi:hypothetical protein PsAD2_02977 [Pseudovibrio axinellae]|uniref:Rad50/SbcC-type AAA domain-containing protein n=1 Tax=Pseudovibrio axinellae TaxID=989403 RepID=A0A165XEW3_9HYPH|nr:hypothetical protein [Pseudovibrio axinellae]KZL17641.1 hypothetical protein PsAD2_02977 [Pseudovibrio axinellae]SER45282.1 hypothetical protein SAMN05421798_110105 [Pseudovibrio axinellae]